MIRSRSAAIGIRRLCTSAFAGVRPSLARALRDEFAIFEPNELQAKALPIALEGHLQLEGNNIGDEGMRHLGDALANGAAPALQTLNLQINKFGDEGARHLGDALARGAAPALKTLWLSGNDASDDAKQAVRDALKQVRSDFRIL